MGYLFGQKRRKVSRLQRQAARCFLVTQEASSVELGTWCWPRVVLIEKRPLTECERSSMNRAARSVGACQSRQRPSAAFCRASSLGHRISGESQGQSDFARVYTTKPLVRAPSGYATATLAPSKGRLMRCTVDGLTPNRSAMTRMPGRPGVARASRIRFSSAEAIGGRPRRFPTLRALASPARTRSWIMARSNSANTPII